MRYLVANDSLCACSRDCMRADSSSIWAFLILFLLAAMDMSSPLIIHLCAAHIVAGEESAEMFSSKFWERHLVIFCIFSRSVKRELSRRQITDVVCVVGSVSVMVMGLWSESSIVSIVASVRKVRSF